MRVLTITSFVALSGLVLVTSGLRRAASTELHWVAGQMYEPPKESSELLGHISELLRHADPIDKDQFEKHSATFVATLPGGELYFEVPTMDVDDDGDTDGAPARWDPHPVRRGKVDFSHQEGTSYGSMLPRLPGHTDRISAFKVPYLVLPGGKARPYWFEQRGIHIGDGAILIRGNQCLEAVFADAGPINKIGEMSLRAHQLFGETVFTEGAKAQSGADGTPIRDTRTGKLVTVPALITRNVATKGPFVVIVFPGTSVGRKFETVDTSLKSVIDQRFQSLVR